MEGATMANKAAKGKRTRPGKGAAPASVARVERRKKTGKKIAASEPKVAKGSLGTGGKGGGLH
ncbi:MAG: hypothetical protein ACJ741_11590 [Pyrinomonadaceae bacterium]